MEDLPFVLAWLNSIVIVVGWSNTELVHYSKINQKYKLLTSQNIKTK